MRQIAVRGLLFHPNNTLQGIFSNPSFVGDTGWRLSQGERSRIFLARALLQKAEVVVLDESLAALDPANFRQCLECILRRAPKLLLIAHG